MRIVFFQPYLAAWRAEFLSRFVRESKHEVIVVDGGFKSPKAKQTADTRNHSFSPLKLWSLSPVFSIGKQTYPLYFSPFLLFSLVRIKPDCIVTEGEINFLNNISIWIYCFLFRRHYVWWSLGKVRTRKKTIVNKIFDPIVEFLLRRASIIMTRNSYAARYYKEKGLPAERIIIAPNCMDEERAREELNTETIKQLREQKGTKKILLYVGALSPEKRPADLIEVLIKARERGYQDIGIWYVGDGVEKAQLESLVREHKLESFVTFFGRVLSGVGNYFSAADLVVVPGLGGLVINHAMIFGKPVISRPADGTEEDLIQDGITGYIVRSDSNDALLEKVLAVLYSSNYDEMSHAAKQVVDSRWNMKNMIEAVNQCIQKALEAKAKI
jgi:Glycosyltransferase